MVFPILVTGTGRLLITAHEIMSKLLDCRQTDTELLLQADNIYKL